MARASHHANIPVFIPHLGCPNDCVFCDQRTISGVGEFRESHVKELIDRALATVGDRRAEIAFFGGSFTGIDRGLMVRLLDMAESYVREGRATGIRMSTRPDYITPEIIDIIGSYTLSEVELGIQSMSEHVLTLSRRGHTADDTRRACRLLTAAGIPFVGQMMIGLPGSEEADEVQTACEICQMGAAGCRIYPTVVFRGTCLETLSRRGEYTPLSLEDAVSRSASALEVFCRCGVKCLRVGLQDGEELHRDTKYYAGPLHPAMGELVRGEILRRRMCLLLDGLCGVTEIEVRVPRGCVSTAVGIRGRNRDGLTEKYGLRRIKFTEDATLTGLEIKIAPLSHRDSKKHNGGESHCI